MHRRGVCAVVTAVLSLSSIVPLSAQQKPARTFSLSARFGALLAGNRVECGMVATGEICTDHTGSTVLTWSAWPAGTANHHIFNSGPAIAGIIGADGGPWAGDTTGGFFFDTKGTTVHSSVVEEIHDSRDPADLAAWPEPARVPAAGPVADFFHPSLRGRIAASEQDFWWVMTETDPTLVSGRTHPLGVVVEARAMAFGSPAGADDVVYLLYTFHNVTSLDPAAYASAAPAIRPLLLEQAQRLHQRVQAELGVILPAGGYTIRRFHAGTLTDADVADAGANYEGINPASRYTYAYEHTFDREFPVSGYGWTFDAGIFGTPFLEGPGFVAVAPLGGGPGTTEFQVATNLAGSGNFGSPQNTTQLYRYLSGEFSVAAGDEPCSYNPATTRVCFLNNTGAMDIRGMVSSALPDLPPGGSATLVTAYVFAPPVAVPGFVPGPSVDVKPGALVLPDAAALAAGVPLSDSLAGYAGFEDVNGDGLVAPEEFIAVTGSLKHKAQIARAFFQAGFLRPSAPEAPEFFLVPGDGRVTVVWRPSLTEEVGDPYADLAEAPRRADGTINPLYDPNFRRLDVEGYRIWRGRSDQPGEMELVAQFDYQQTTFWDHDGLVVSSAEVAQRCAPELGVTDGCPVTFDPAVPGQARAAAAEYDIGWYDLVQVRVDGQRPQRIRLATGSSLPIRMDSAVTGRGTGYPPLTDTGVPFVFTDSSVSNGFRYTYAVTAFDVNSIRSGPASLESPRTGKAVTPRESAVNRELAGAVGVMELHGRNGVLDPDTPVPTLDPERGIFSGPFPPADGTEVQLPQFDPALFSADGEVTVRLDSVVLGSAFGGAAHSYWYTILAGRLATVVRVPVVQSPTIGSLSGMADAPALPVDEAAVASHGGSADYLLPVRIRHGLSGTYYAGGHGRGCLNGALGFSNGVDFRGCAYNGSRWFDGPSPLRNETVPHPQRGNTGVFTSTPMADLNNGGALTGVRTIFQPQAYISASTLYRQVEGVLAGARRSADYNVHWGPGGQVDSVIDVTHDVPVPFAAERLGATWGILNTDAAQPSGVGVSYDQRAELTSTDFACVEPLRSDPSAAAHMPCGTGPGTGPQYLLSEVAVPGPVAGFSGMNTANARTAPALPQAGFAMYLAGNIFLFELEGGQVPAAGAVWSLRDYVGAISGGGCATCGDGEYFDGYAYRHFFTQPLTAVGVELRLTYEVANAVRAATNADLARAHPVPDPYYALRAAGLPEEQAGIAFVHLPADAIVRIYSLSGRLVRVLEHDTDADGTVRWDVRNRDGKPVASGVYFFHIESGRARKAGRMTIVNSATLGGE